MGINKLEELQHLAREVAQSVPTEMFHEALRRISYDYEKSLELGYQVAMEQQEAEEKEYQREMAQVGFDGWK